MSEHAIANAKGWAETMLSAAQGLAAFEDGAETVAFDGDEFDSADALTERLQEMPLSVQVREDWHDAGDTGARPAFFMILLSTGGPALRIVGELDEYGQPYKPALQWQDWGTPWTTLHELSEREEAAIQSFAGQFYYGEG